MRRVGLFRSVSEEKAYRALAGKSEGRILIETTRSKREDNIKKRFERHVVRMCRLD